MSHLPAGRKQTQLERKNSESSRFRCPVSSVCWEEAYIIGKTVVPLGWGPLAVWPRCWSPFSRGLGPNKIAMWYKVVLMGLIIKGTPMPRGFPTIFSLWDGYRSRVLLCFKTKKRRKKDLYGIRFHAEETNIHRQIPKQMAVTNLAAQSMQLQLWYLHPGKWAWIT